MIVILSFVMFWIIFHLFSSLKLKDGQRGRSSEQTISQRDNKPSHQEGNESFLAVQAL